MRACSRFNFSAQDDHGQLKATAFASFFGKLRSSDQDGDLSARVAKMCEFAPLQFDNCYFLERNPFGEHPKLN